MSDDSLFEELATLTALDAPPGFEEPVLELARDRFAALCDSVEVDVRGNVYAYRSGTSPDAPTVAVLSHADEIGLQVTRIEPDGFLRFTKLGGMTESVLPGARVRVLATRGKVEGVVGVRPGHVMSSAQRREVSAVRDMYIDIGSASESETAALGIEPGTPVVSVGPLHRSSNPRRIFGKAIDNRAGLLAQLRLAEHAAKNPPPCGLVFVVTVEEEVGLRGAAVAGRKIDADVVIALDTVPAGGTPDVSPLDLPWEIGKGPLLKVRETRGLITHRPLREHFRAVADEHRIPIQTIVDTAGVTDATSFQQASGDIAALTLGLARRYAHSAVEMLDLDDLQHLIQLLCLAVPRLASQEMLRRV